MIYIEGEVNLYMLKNHGIRNEYLFVQNINNKKFRNLNFLLQDLVKYLFPEVEKNDVLKCYKNVEYEKGDICIKLNGNVKYVSIKMGHGNSVHGEKLEKFSKFLLNLNVPQDIINQILKYHYADGTLDGSGKVRISSQEYKEKSKNSIETINKFLNSEYIIKEAIKRFIIKGTQWHLNNIDVLVYGTYDNFLFVTVDEIYEYILSKSNNPSSAIHFSILTYQPESRVLNYDSMHEYQRHSIQIKWYNLEDNIIEILNNRVIRTKKYFPN